ncbi:MAG: LamG domain-containing protein [Cyanobacteria bacterium SBLK]|nr:LamG domain-containing protein [Cyanobacteria bacterium SBLK]
MQIHTVLCSAATLITLSLPCHAATLIHHYEFTDNVTDSVGNANGTLLNGATVSNGQLVLDGIDDYVQFSDKIVPTSGSYSVALFAQQNAIQNNYVELISQGANQGITGEPGFYIGYTPNQTIRVTDSWGNTGISFPSDGLLHHYAMTVDSDNQQTKLYIDGILQATLNAAISTGAIGSDTRLGRQFAPFDEFFNGTMDDVRIYTGALTDIEISNLQPVDETDVPEFFSIWGLGASLLLGTISVKKQGK